MSEVAKYKLKPPSVTAAPYDEIYDALQTIAKLVNAKSTKVNSDTQRAEFILSDDGQAVFTIEIGQMFVKDGDQLKAMSKEEFAGLYERY